MSDCTHIDIRDIVGDAYPGHPEVEYWIEAKDVTAIDWDDREQREELRERVGLDEFHRLYDEMLAR